MRDYIKPFIEDESIEIEDICVPSGVQEQLDLDDDDTLTEGGDL